MSSTPLIGVLQRRGDGLLEHRGGSAGIDRAHRAPRGGAISGYCAIGSTRIAARPASTMKMEMTTAKIGRSMKKRGEHYFIRPRPSCASPLPPALGGARYPAPPGGGAFGSPSTAPARRGRRSSPGHRRSPCRPASGRRDDPVGAGPFADRDRARLGDCSLVRRRRHEMRPSCPAGLPSRRAAARRSRPGRCGALEDRRARTGPAAPRPRDWELGARIRRSGSRCSRACR